MYNTPCLFNGVNICIYHDLKISCTFSPCGHCFLSLDCVVKCHLV